MEPPRDRLDSWKEIAEYLGRDRTTVMRWERTAGLPVRRVQGERGKAVFAYKPDLDRWLLNQPILPGESDAPAPPAEAPAAVRSRVPAGAWITALLLVLVAGFVISQASPSGIVSSVALAGREIVAQDAGGSELWRVRLPHIEGTIIPARLVVSDLHGDGRPEVVAALHFQKSGRRDQGVLLVLESDGSIRWQHALDDRYRFGGEEYGPAWFPVDIVVHGSAERRRISVAYHHHTWWPGVVATYDTAGRPIARFVNAGWITALNVSADSRYLLGAGVNNSLGGAVLAVLDRDDPAGVSPAGGGALPPCSNCPDGRPVSYFFAPWTELARPSDTPPVLVQVMPSGTIEWRAVQRAAEHGKVPEVIVTLSPDLQVLARSVNDFFPELRERLVRAGELAQGRGASREPTIRRWTSPTGWR